MKGNPEVIEHLNKILGNEVTAISQYFLHARVLKNWGILRLADTVYQESIGEMKHADLLIERILMLDGMPNLTNIGKMSIGDSVPQMLHSDLGLETHNQSCLKPAIELCESARDFVSRDILASILEETEEHIDWLETQIDLVEKVGLQNYLQEHMFEPGEG